MVTDDKNAPFDADAALAAIEVDEDVENDPEEPEEPEAAPEEEPEGEPAPTTIDLGDGTSVPLEELKAGYLRQSDYTRKTQEVSQQRTQLEPLIQAAEILTGNDQAAKIALARQVAESVGLKIVDDGLPGMPRQQTQPDMPEWDDMTETERFLYMQNHSLQSKLNEALPILQRTHEFIRGQEQAKQVSAASLAASQSLKESLGVVVPDSELAEAVRATGIQDPEAAWLKLNKGRIAQGFKAEGIAQGVKAKPMTPDMGGGKTFDPSGLSATQIQQMLMKGYQVKR
jgi:hypothetical protein